MLVNTKPPPSWCGVVDRPTFDQPTLHRVERRHVDDGGVVVLDDEGVTATTTRHVGGYFAATYHVVLAALLVTPHVPTDICRVRQYVLDRTSSPTYCRVAS